MDILGDLLFYQRKKLMYAKEEFRGKNEILSDTHLHWNFFRNEDGYIAYFQWYYEGMEYSP